MANCHSCTALNYAVLRGDVTIVQSVLEHMAMQADADLNNIDQYGQTALAVALGFVTELDNNKKHRVPSSICVALIDAG